MFGVGDIVLGLGRSGTYDYSITHRGSICTVTRIDSCRMKLRVLKTDISGEVGSNWE